MELKTQKTEALNLLLMGNNPIEMGHLLDKMNRVPGKKIITEIAFDLSSLLQRLIHFKPNYILIDDNVGKPALTETVRALADSRKTKDIPIMVLKNSNYEETHSGPTFLDYILKQNFSSDALMSTLKNSFKMRRTQQYLQQAYQKRRKQVKSLLS